MDKKVLGRKLRIRRTDLGLTQDEVAEAFGMTHTAVSLWEIGKTTPSHRYFEKLSDILKVPIQFFYEADFWPGDEGYGGHPEEGAKRVVAGSYPDLSEADEAWCRRMEECLRMMPIKSRESFRRTIENDAIAIQKFVQIELNG